MESALKSLSEVGSVPFAIYFTALVVSFYWLKTEVNKIWNEIMRIKEDHQGTNDRVIEMANDIKWIRENINKKIK